MDIYWPIYVWALMLDNSMNKIHHDYLMGLYQITKNSTNLPNVNEID